MAADKEISADVSVAALLSGLDGNKRRTKNDIEGFISGLTYKEFNH